MAETLKRTIMTGETKWLWHSVIEDLIELGGICPYKIEWSFSHPQLFMYDKKLLFISWAKDLFFLLSMKDDDRDLEDIANAFSKVLEYKPFCKYQEQSGLYTYEWDKKDPGGRYKALIKEGKGSITRLL